MVQLKHYCDQQVNKLSIIFLLLNTKNKLPLFAYCYICLHFRVKGDMKCDKKTKKNWQIMMAASILFEKKAELGLLDEHTSHVTTTFPAEGFNESLGGLPLITFKTVWITWFVELMLKNNYQLQNYSSKVSTFTNLDMSWQWNLVMRTLEVTYIKSQVLYSMRKTCAFFVS